jgi:hypothetical protein
MAAVPSLRGITSQEPSLRPAVAVTPQSWLQRSTLLTAYGRAFATAPILGRLGEDRNLDDMANQLEPMKQSVVAATGGRPVQLAIHLIYGLATPCSENEACLLYLDEQSVDLVEQYIKPAAARGWLVILDDQLGRSTPAREIRRMIERGSLQYDNVQVAFDPEFRAMPGQAMPGVPTGYVTAGELNRAARLMQRSSQSLQLAHRKLMLVHTWLNSMIRHPRLVHKHLPYVQPVAVMDGIGPADEKAGAYNTLLGSPGNRAMVPGIKLFPPNPYDPSGHWDEPLLTGHQLFDAQSSNQNVLARPPRVIVMT